VFNLTTHPNGYRYGDPVPSDAVLLETMWVG